MCTVSQWMPVSHEISRFSHCLPDWAQGLRHSQFLVDTLRTRSASAWLPINRIYPLFWFSLTDCRYFHILSTCNALDRWGGKWNHLSMTPRLTTDCAKNYCNRTLVVKVIVENVVTCFFYGTQCSLVVKPTQSARELHTLQHIIWQNIKKSVDV